MRVFQIRDVTYDAGLCLVAGVDGTDALVRFFTQYMHRNISPEACELNGCTTAEVGGRVFSAVEADQSDPYGKVEQAKQTIIERS